MSVSVFMYHAIYSTDLEYMELPEEDRPYAISLDVFQQQLDLLITNNIILHDAMDFKNSNVGGDESCSVLLTFDDGHVSFFQYVFPELLKRKITAIFFVTSDFICNRENFCNWKQLSEMVANGMSVQSHGCTHKFISDMGYDESHYELFHSKSEIENNVSFDVLSISFPGGRYTNRDINIGIDLGYEYFFTSKEGVNKSISKGTAIRRIALRRTTNLNEYLKLANGNKITIARRYFIHLIKNMIKKLIGNSVYHLLYKGVK